MLIWLGPPRARIKPPGLFALYVFGYSAYRIFEEYLRIDSSVYILGLRLNMYIACALTVVGAVWFYLSQRLQARVLAAGRPPRSNRKTAPRPPASRHRTGQPEGSSPPAGQPGTAWSDPASAADPAQARGSGQAAPGASSP